jgi:ribosomal protein S18 acetylase RimI-like enzyme
MGVIIESLHREAVPRHQTELVTLLEDAVDSGASIGFLPPVSVDEATAYWRSVADAVGEGSRVLLIARDGDRVAGSVQLDLALRPNARHRAEVAKVMVHRAARRRGIGRALMVALEEEARRLGRTTLVLDTRQGDPSEGLYRSLGWHFAGAIPGYARSAGGTLDGTAIYYKLLSPAGQGR